MAYVATFNKQMFRCPGCGAEHAFSMIRDFRSLPFNWHCYCAFECIVTSSSNGGFTYETRAHDEPQEEG